MRFPRVREEDGRLSAGECELCGGDIGAGQDYYLINGQVICEDCLAAYAQRYFAAYLCRGGEDTWR